MSDVQTLQGLIAGAVERADPYRALALHPYANGGSRQALEEVLFAGRRQRIQFAGAPYTPPSVLGALVRFPDPKVRERLARNPRTPAETLDRLFHGIAQC